MSIKIENLSHIYNAGSPFEARALDQINLEIQQGEFVGLIGHTGSGKSTLTQHLNGLLKPSEGKLYINGVDMTDKNIKMSEIRKKVGLVFQYPEHQLFEETVFQDIAFGPTNLGIPQEEVDQRVKEAMELVKLPFEELRDRSPFELSGGQRRRVAIAGVLAMRPEVLILDEPTAGLDPRGRDEILMQIKAFHGEMKNTVILVSHSMEDIAKLVERIVVMHHGKIALTGTVSEVFRHAESLEAMGLGVPQIAYLVRKLQEENIVLGENIYTVEQAKEEIIKWVRSQKNA